MANILRRVPVLLAAAQMLQHGEAAVTADAGVDFRYFGVFTDNLPAYQNSMSAASATDPQQTEYYHYSRFRIRPWGQVGIDDRYDVYGRLGNEFRFYDNNRQIYSFPSEVYIDSLYIDLRDMWDGRLSVRAGRQDIRYGAGRVIWDGTPGDVSRSYHFDAVKATLKLSESSTLDLAGMWQRPEDPWTLGHEQIDLTRYHTRKGGNDLTERGLVAYYINRDVQDFPWELYYVYKDESRWWSGNNAKMPARRYHTGGLRATPRFNCHWAAEAEIAGQCGESGGRDIMAWMAYAGATYTAAEWRWKPYATVAALVLSGDGERFDDPGARGTDTGWNPVFGRMVWTSDIMTAPYACYRLSNLVYPHAEVGMTIGGGHAATLQSGPQFAYSGDNSNGDTLRGWLMVARYFFPLVRESEERRGAIRGIIKLEVLDAGGYYGDPATAYYLRFEIHARF